jgi:hypothetical protein
MFVLGFFSYRTNWCSRLFFSCRIVPSHVLYYHIKLAASDASLVILHCRFAPFFYGVNVRFVIVGPIYWKKKNTMPSSTTTRAINDVKLLIDLNSEQKRAVACSTNQSTLILSRIGLLLLFNFL